VTKVTGVRKYFYTNPDGKEREIAPDRIFRVPGFTVDGDWGVSAIEYGAGVFGSALAAQSAANSTFEKGMMPTVAYTVPGAVNPAQREEFRGMVKEVTGAMNSGNPVVLENGMTAAALGIKPSDSQLLESRQFSVEEICRWFRVPPFMVGHTAGSTNWGTGIEQQMIGFLTFTLRPWLTRVEQAITKELLAPGDRGKFYAEFSVEGLLRADSAGRMTYLSQAVNNGLMSRDEARAKENLAPRGGNADVLTVQTALIPIDKLGTTAPVQKVPTNET
jgi:HK97 family phage portal protein